MISANQNRASHLDDAATYPAWVRELDLSLPITGQYLITGNVHDQHYPHAEGSFCSTVDLIEQCLVANEYDLVYRFDSLDGIRLDHVADQVVSNDFFPDAHLNRATVGSVAKLADLMMQSASQSQTRVALIVESASNIWADADNVEAGRLLLASRRLATREVTRVPGGSRTVSPGNTIIWISESENDAPDWLRPADNARTLRVPLPSLSARRLAAGALLTELPGFDELGPEGRTEAIDLFADSTQGVTIRGMRSMTTLARDQELGPEHVDEAVRSYLAGIVDNPWQDPLLLARIRRAPETIEQRVLGQSRAVQRATDILLRSALGLTGAHQGRRGRRPQGILFFAGPTGVGKTELAKTLAEVLFGAEDAYIRFDMSEFSAEHSEARLIGAPPGYIGHSAGGELTNAVREKPFSVLLFDEIEKAHPRILDKFLQILDDGRLTDGSGNTVFFSESVIIFTSNLGAARAITGADAGDSAAAHDQILAEIQRHFLEELERPELLSRIGDNIIVFDSITAPVGRQLVAQHIDAVASTVRARLGASLDVSAAARETIESYALTKLPFGGRGIATAIETALVNPLARALADAAGASQLTVVGAALAPDGWVLTVELSTT
ncbi:AAA family ATPase [Microbacterium sp.]|uniref:AAA family ATPase n=1 Tax=Microbacterium sp. TaxID=51671 RepID=UPI003F94AB12